MDTMGNDIPRRTIKPQIRPEQYERMLATYRTGEDRIAFLARAGGVNRKTAERGMKTGWPPYFPSFPQAVEHDRERARAKAIDDLTALSVSDRAVQVHALAQDEAVTVLAEEARLLKLARQDVASVLALVAEMQPAMRVVALDLREAVAALAKKNEHLPVKDALGLIKRYAEIIRLGADAAAQLVQVERQTKGDPLAVATTNDLTEEEAAAQLEEVVRRWEELKGKPNLTLVQGGLAPEHPDGAA